MWHQIRKTHFSLLHTVRKVGANLGWGALPDFIIIGAMRCGTTSLYRYLKGHPEIRVSSAKETHFFDNNYHRGLLWYKAFFPLAINRGKQSIDSPLREQYLRGEASPYYIYHPIVPRRIAAVVPHAKFIVLLRNPIARTYSHYQHELEKGRESRTFDEVITDALKNEAEKIRAEEEHMLQDETYHSRYHQQFSYLTRSVYYPQLLRWLELFDRKQFQVLISEDFFSTPDRIFGETLRFLGVRNTLWCPKEFEKHHLRGGQDTIKPETRAILADYFKPHNQKLAELLNRNIDWD